METYSCKCPSCGKRLRLLRHEKIGSPVTCPNRLCKHVFVLAKPIVTSLTRINSFLLGAVLGLALLLLGVTLFASSPRWTRWFKRSPAPSAQVIQEDRPSEVLKRNSENEPKPEAPTAPARSVETVSESATLGRQYALLIGIRQYEHSALSQLRYTENDVTEMAQLLKQQSYEVVLLTNSTGTENPSLKPTRTNIVRQLKGLLARCKREDTVLIGFAGHGMQFAGQDDCFFCPTDARPFQDETHTLVSLNGVYNEMRKCGAGAKLLLVDACRNDPSRDRGRGIGQDNAPSPPKGVGVLFSCSTGERAYEPDALKHGVFFYYVLEGLRGKAKDPTDDEVNWDTLRAYVKKQVSRELPRLEQGKVQHPQEKGELAGASPVLVRVKGSNEK